MHVISATSRPPRRRTALGLSLFLSVAALTTACDSSTIHFSNEPGVLPALTGIDKIRDEAVRTEVAAIERADSLAQALTNDRCPQCATALQEISTNSAQRLTTLGGVWQPWEDNVNEDVERPPAVADAPMTVESFISWLVAGAQRDLAVAADPSVTHSQDSLVLASTALGRYADARALSEAYGVDLFAGSAALNTANSRLVGRQEAELIAQTNVGTWSLSSDDLLSNQSLPAVEYVEGDSSVSGSAELAEAIVVWDCVAQTLPRTEVLDGQPLDATVRSDRLMVRVDRILDTGVADQRIPRCSLESRQVEELARNLIAADISLLNSESAAVRLTGLHAALEDISDYQTISPQAFGALVGVTQAG
ncbi:hypothetical protein [Schaalia vaccimaxillae]|uniref:hypothetical protein n=1 Tax=Schaalia vaccimaxillae TaxID=183916 RepID=UPI0003B662D3|nr:hypothetical protein [Schaalia vaccimaxillae]